MALLLGSPCANLCGYLPLPTVAKLCSTSKHLRSLLSDAETWRERVVAEPSALIQKGFFGWMHSLPRNSVQIAKGHLAVFSSLMFHAGSLKEARLRHCEDLWLDKLFVGKTFPQLSKMVIRVDVQSQELYPSNIGTRFLRDIMRACPNLIALHLAVFGKPKEVIGWGSSEKPEKIFGRQGEFSASSIFGKRCRLRELSVTGDQFLFAQFEKQILHSFGRWLPHLEILSVPVFALNSASDLLDLLHDLGNLRQLCVWDFNARKFLRALQEDPSLVPNLSRLRILTKDLMDLASLDMGFLEEHAALQRKPERRELSDIIVCHLHNCCVRITNNMISMTRQSSNEQG